MARAVAGDGAGGTGAVIGDGSRDYVVAARLLDRSRTGARNRPQGHDAEGASPDEVAHGDVEHSRRGPSSAGVPLGRMNEELLLIACQVVAGALVIVTIGLAIILANGP